MGDNATYCDMISELPDFILHQILSWLSSKLVAQTCVISKRWRHIWETFPILVCNEMFFGKYLWLINPKEFGLSKEERRVIFYERLKFMSYIDEKLRYIFVNDRCLKKFRLVMTLVSVGLIPRVDAWMDLVVGLNVQKLELFLTLGRERFYTLPIRVLASQSLTVVSLTGRILIDCLSKEDLKFSSLVEVNLSGSYIDEESILNLVSSLQSMKILSLRACLGFTKLQIHGHKKLKKVVYHPHEDVNLKKFSINLPNLKELDFAGSRSKTAALRFTDHATHVVSPNLKDLFVSTFSIDAKSLGDIFSSFRLLERLYFSKCTVKESVKLSSPILKEVKIEWFPEMGKAVFDTPRLQVFKYCGRVTDDLIISNITGNRIAELYVELKDMDRSWFMKLNDFLRRNIFQELILIIIGVQGHEIASSTVDYKLLLQPLELRSLKLDFIAYGSVKSDALWDGLFGNMHPSKLEFEINHNSAIHLKGLLKCLVDGAEPMCCRGEDLQCWRHSLKAVKLGKFRGFQAGTPLDLCTLSSLNSFLDNWVIEEERIRPGYGLKVEAVFFDLSW